MFAVIHVPNFSLQAVLRREPELRAAATALIDAAPAQAAKAVVLEATGRAVAAGVISGLTVPQAMARCRELVLKTRSPEAERAASNILLQTACAFTPHIEDTAPGLCTMDLRGLHFRRDPGSETSSGAVKPGAPREELDQNLHAMAAPQPAEQPSFGFFPEAQPAATQSGNSLMTEWAGKILVVLRQLGLHAQIGIATTPNLAWLAAQAAGEGTVLMVERVAEFFANLPVEALAPAPPVLAILKRWGIHTAGAFLALGPQAVTQRLGAEALELFERASPNRIRPLRILVPADLFEERMEFEAQIETLEPLLFVLHRFVEQLSTRIGLTYRVVAELQLHLALESGAAYERTFKVPAPTANVQTLFRMLHTHLENLHTDSPVVSLRLTALPTRAESQQFRLFESTLRDPNHFQETLARLTALLGSERVGTPVPEASHRPDAFQMTTPQFGESPSPRAEIPPELRNPKTEARSAPGLCLRRFRPAIHADVELENGRPVFINTLLVSGPIRRARGPWCASGTWWDQHRWSRQEWDVEMREGVVYRLFQSEGGWLVEGSYD